MCFWEDDGQDDHDADEIRSGPNRGLSLSEARRNFADDGASDRRRLQSVSLTPKGRRAYAGHGAALKALLDEPATNPSAH